MFAPSSALFIAIVLCFSRGALADIDVRQFQSESARDTYQALTRELRCPKCQNQDIADSNAPIAQDMRAQVHRLVEEGKSHEQVVEYMIERFGEFVTYKPKVSAETYLLWYGPWVFVSLGVIAIVVLSRKKNIAVKSARLKAGDDVNINIRESQETKRSSPPDQEQSVKELLEKYSDDT